MDIRFKFVPSYNTSEYFKLNKCVFFMHIPKSGGTTIDHIFAKIANIIGNFKYERFKYSLDYKKTKLFHSNLKNQMPKFISGHLDYNFTGNLKNFFKCALVREPSSRVISHYKFTLFKLKKNPLDYTFEQFINDEIRNNRDNLTTRHFCGMLNVKKKIDKLDKDEAIKNIKLFDIVQTIENWDLFLSELLTKFGFPSVLYSRYQEHKYSFEYQPTKINYDLINNFFEYDYDVYSTICNLNIKNKNFTKKDYNKNICIVSPYFNSENRIYHEDEIKKMFIKN